MAGYTNYGMHSRQSSYDHMTFGYDAYDNSNQLILDSDSMSRSGAKKINIFIIFVFILELLVLVFLSVLEYFLRQTDVFPVREMNFTCGDPDLSYTKDQGELTYREFAYFANVSYEIVVPLCFCVPPAIMLVCELALWGFTEEPQKMVRALCPQCKLPQVVRRIIRFIGTFLFGILITMIFVDVTKMFIGRLRPNFLSICKPADCTSGEILAISTCTESSDWELRQARLSFPSFHAAISAFAATFTAVYVHNIIRASSVRILRPFLALGFMLMSVMCCLVRYGLHYSHWTDVAVGFGVGLIFALYTCISVLHQFRERLSGNVLYQHIREFMFEQRALELRELYREGKLHAPPSRGHVPWYYHWSLNHEERVPYANYPGTGVYAGGIILPRPHLHANGGQPNESNTDDVEGPGEVIRAYHPYSTHSLPPRSQQPAPIRTKNLPTRAASPPQSHNTFQRDLHRSLDQYRHNDFGHL